MSTIAINYVVNENIDEKRVDKILKGLDFKNHEVILNVYDFSLNKECEKLFSNANAKNLNISVVEKDYEDLENSQEIILKDFIRYVDSKVLCIIFSNLVLNPEEIDKIDIDKMMSDEICGFIFSDYHVNNIRMFMKSHSINSELNSPFVLWKTEQVISNIASSNLLNVIYSKTLGVHIPESLCTAIIRNE